MVAIHDVVFSSQASLEQTQGVMTVLNKVLTSTTVTVGGASVTVVGTPVLITTKGTEG